MISTQRMNGLSEFARYLNLHCRYDERPNDFEGDAIIRGSIIFHDVEEVNDFLQDAETMSEYKKVMLSEGRTMQEEFDSLIDVAIRYESHDCYLLLVEYKRSHNLYQANPFEL